MVYINSIKKCYNYFNFYRSPITKDYTWYSRSWFTSRR